jgi:hypothetical protein
MKIEGFIFLILKVFYIMNMNEAVKRRRNNIVEVREKLYFCDPTVMNLLFNDLYSILLLLKSRWLLLKQGQYLIRL